MKKLFLVSLLLLAMVGWCGSVWAGSACTETLTYKYDGESLKTAVPKVATYEVDLLCTADVSTAAFADTALSTATLNALRGWYLYKIKTWPGATQPKAASDFTITDPNSLDVIGGLGADKITTSAQAFLVQPSTGFPVVASEVWTVKIANNDVTSAITNIKLIFVK